MLNLVARSTMFRNSNTCSSEIDSDTVIEFGVRYCQLCRQVAFRRCTLRANVALQFRRSSNRNFIGSANPQSATQQLLGRMSQIFVNAHDGRLLPHWVSPQELLPLRGVVRRGTRHQVWPFLQDPFPHLRLDKPQVSGRRRSLLPCSRLVLKYVCANETNSDAHL